jgi:hypothetical protein
MFAIKPLYDLLILTAWGTIAPGCVAIANPEYLHEFPFSVYNVAECLEESAPGRYTVRGQTGSIPLLFSVRARLDGERCAEAPAG